MTDTEPGTFAFENFTLDTARGTVTSRGRELSLRPKSYAVLEYLAQRPGTLVSRRELLDQVWGSTVVTGDSVTQCIVEIRKALGDADRTLIRTLPRRGFRLEATPVDPTAVARSRTGGAPGTGESRAAHRLGHGKRLLLSLPVLLVAVWLVFGLPTPARNGPGEVADALPSGASEVPSALDPANALARARYYYHRRGPGDLDRAEAEYRRLLRAEPRSGSAWAGLASILRLKLFAAGLDDARALEAYRESVRQALRYGDGLAEAHVAGARLAMLEGDADAARAQLDRALALEPDDPIALSVLAGEALHAGRRTEALLLQQRAVNSAPASFVQQANLGTMLLAAGRYEDAVPTLATALDLRPDDGPTRRNLADALLIQGDVAGVEEILARWPGDRHLAPLGELLAALRGGTTPAELVEDDPRALLTAAEAHVLQGDPGAALTVLEVVAARLPEVEPMALRAWCADRVLYGPYFRVLESDPRWTDIAGPALRVDRPRLHTRNTEEPTPTVARAR